MRTAGCSPGSRRRRRADSQPLPRSRQPTSACGPPTDRTRQPGPDRDRPFDGPLVPEQILVLTYNVKAAKELQARLDDAVGPATRSRMTVSNFHSFCNRVLTESAADAGLPPNPDVLDGVGQVLLLRDIRPQLPLVYHTDWWLPQFVAFINRAKDELVTPADFEAFVAEERRVFEERHGPYEAAAERLERQGNLRAPREVRKAYADLRRLERADAARVLPDEEARRRMSAEELADAFRPDLAADAEVNVEKAADREARRTISGDGHPHPRNQFDPDQQAAIDALAATYVEDAAALEVMRLTELATVYRAYQAELVRRGALDFGEQIAAVTQLFKVRPNVLRRWQRQFRYLLVDEFQDANVAQIELIEMLGRTPDRPDNVMVVGDDDQSIYRFRGASFAAFTEFDTRFSRPPIHDPTARPPGPPPRLRLEENFRSVDSVLQAANRLIQRNQARYEPDKRLRTEREAGRPGRARRLRRARGRGGRHRRRDRQARRRRARSRAGRTSPSSTASTSTATRSSPGCATRTSRTRSSAGCRCSSCRRSATSSSRCGRSPTPTTTSR